MKYVVVNRHRVHANARTGEDEPVFRISEGKHGRPRYARAVEFPEGGRLVYNPEQPMPCGARVWLEAPTVQEKG